MISVNNDEETVQEACWAIAFYSDSLLQKEERLKQLADMKLFDRILDLIDEDNNDIIRPLLRVLSHISYTNNDTISLFYKPKLVQIFYDLLHTSDLKILYDVIWIINNFICTSEEIANDFFIPDIMNLLIEISYRVGSKSIKAEVFGVVLALIEHKVPDIMEKLVTGYKIIDICMDHLKDEGEDVINNCLDIIGSILDYGEAFSEKNQVVEYIVEKYDLEVFVDLQAKNSTEIYDKVSSLIQEYFNGYFENQ